MKKKIMYKLYEWAPEWSKEFGKILGLDRPYQLIMEKEGSELAFQRKWAKKLKENPKVIEEYWRKYRHFDKVEALCAIGNYDKVLDVGCGISTVLHIVPGVRMGIDPLADEYREIYRYPNGVKIYKGSGEQIKAPTDNFDVVFCSNVLDHVVDPAETIDEIKRVLKKHGTFVLTVELHDHNHARDMAHPHSLTEKDIYDLVEDFELLYSGKSPFVSLWRYANGNMTHKNEELTLVLRKK